MPLQPGSSRETVSHNIGEMVKSGHPQKQAIAASLANAGLSNKQGENMADQLKVGDQVRKRASGMSGPVGVVIGVNGTDIEVNWQGLGKDEHPSDELMKAQGYSEFSSFSETGNQLGSNQPGKRRDRV